MGHLLRSRLSRRSMGERVHIDSGILPQRLRGALVRSVRVVVDEHVRQGEEVAHGTFATAVLPHPVMKAVSLEVP
eukprot:812157-Heterocapsa_arctica.AAC.1